ncbi:MAG: carboxypeptidase M32, partial [Deinococcus sp.]
MTSSQLGDLRRLIHQLSDLGAAAGLLSWDQETQMPPAAARIRGLQEATLSGLAHELFTAPGVQALLDAPDPESLEPLEQDLLRVVRRDHAKAVRLPTRFVEERTQAQSEAHHAWLRARRDNDFAHFAPHLGRMFRFAREYAEFQGYRDHPYDALLDDYEPGFTTAQLRPLLAELREALVPLVAAAGDAQQARNAG